MEMENTMELSPNPEVIKQFIAQITKNWNEIGEPLFEIRTFSPTGSANPSRFRLDQVAEAVAHIQVMNNLKHNAYMCINPINPEAAIPAGKGATDKDIMAAFYCFADADTQGGMTNIRSTAGPRMTMSVTTGCIPHKRGHAYWELEEPCQNMDAWREVQKSIAANLDTDPAVVNPSRIMRIAGTISYPSEKKREKGYENEMVGMRTEFKEERSTLPLEQLARAFPRVVPVAPAVEIDLGQQAMDRQLATQQVMSGDNWHVNMVRLVGSYVNKGLSDEEIHTITDQFTLSGYSVDDTRQEVQKAIDGARDKGWTPPPDPVQERMEQQFEKITAEDYPLSWPTPYNEFDAFNLPRRHWVYGYDYIKKYISVTASAGGIGKTSAIIVEAIAIATGKPLLDVTVKEQTNVWVINLEDPISEMQMRTIAAMQHYGIEPDEVRGRLYMDGEDTMEITLAAEGRDGLVPNDELLNFMIQKIKENNIGVVILDPFVSAHLVNENNNGSIQAVVAMLRKLARDTNSAVQLVHHIRKGNGDDATIDSVRGAGSLIGAARAARVINRITQDDALALGVSEHESLGIFRIDDGKANLAPPSDKAIYRRMQSVEIANGEHIGVATAFKLPDLFDGVTATNARNVQAVVAEAEDNQTPFKANVQANAYVGHVVADELLLDMNKAAEKAKVKAIVKQWIQSNVLKEAEMYDKRQGRDVKCIVVGEPIRWDEV